MAKQNRFNINVLIAMSIIMFLVYNHLNFFAPRLFNSPDENANFAFISQFEEHSSLWIAHHYDYGEWGSFIHPRSTFADFGNHVTPVGFWGIMVIFGLMAKAIGALYVVYVTPLLTIALAWSLYYIWKKIFDERIAFFATLLFFIHPAVWYYSARSLLPNMPFVAFLGIGAFFLLITPLSSKFKKRHLWLVDDILGISFVLRALLVRPNESVWVVAALLIAVIAFRKHILPRRILLWVVASLVFLCAFLYINTLVYASPVGGYIVSHSLPIVGWHRFILPFGFHPSVMLESIYAYFVKMYWWLVLPACVGILFFVRDRFSRLSQSRAVALRDDGQVVYFYIFAFVSFFLFIYYGSNLDISFSLKTIGVAYSRYWLPAHILSLPFVFIGFKKLAELNDGTKLFGIFGELYLGSVFLLAPALVYSGPDGLFALKAHLGYMDQVKSDVLETTTEDAIVVTDREDKFFWPDRAVMVRFFDPAIGEAVSGLLAKGFKVYYFTPIPDSAQSVKIDAYIKRFDLSLNSVRKYRDHELFLLGRL